MAEGREYPIHPTYSPTDAFHARLLHSGINSALIEEMPDPLRHTIAENILKSLEAKMTWPTKIPDGPSINTRQRSYIEAHTDIERFKKRNPAMSYQQIATDLIKTAVEITNKRFQIPVKESRMGVPIQTLNNEITNEHWWRYRIMSAFNMGLLSRRHETVPPIGHQYPNNFCYQIIKT